MQRNDDHAGEVRNPFDSGAEDTGILAVAVGNTRTRFGLFLGSQLHHPRSVPNSSADEIAVMLAEPDLPVGSSAVVIASVNDPFAAELEASLERGELDSVPRYRIGRDLPIPIRHTLDDASTVGQDRLLNALGAFSRAEQACAVIDCGTAITVDFVDGEGTFHGGAILPGVQAMLHALHAHTRALPEVAYGRAPPAEPAFGKDTRSAMVLGVTAAAVGSIHHLVQRYAEAFGAYPQVIATGGDAPILLEHDEIVEHIVPDLQLIGIHAVCAHALGARRDSDDHDDERRAEP